MKHEPEAAADMLGNILQDPDIRLLAGQLAHVRVQL